MHFGSYSDQYQQKHARFGTRATIDHIKGRCVMILGAKSRDIHVQVVVTAIVNIII